MLRGRAASDRGRSRLGQARRFHGQASLPPFGAVPLRTLRPFPRVRAVARETANDVRAGPDRRFQHAVGAASTSRQRRRHRGHARLPTRSRHSGNAGEVPQVIWTTGRAPEGMAAIGTPYPPFRFGVKSKDKFTQISVIPGFAAIEPYACTSVDRHGDSTGYCQHPVAAPTGTSGIRMNPHAVQ